jgi:SOS-response transcriptional repressor LexA
LKEPTARQTQALRYIRDYIHLHDRSPSEEELARHLGISAPAAHDLVIRMERSGLVRRKPGAARSVRPSDDSEELQREAKAIVLLAFRNGPIEGIHAEAPCPQCEGKEGVSRITDAEMKTILKTAVNRVFTLLVARASHPDVYDAMIQRAEPYTTKWDAPEAANELIPRLP